jgi:8-oxo-dGTP diphosphatase
MRFPLDSKWLSGDDIAMVNSDGRSEGPVRRRGAVAVVMREHRFLVIRRSDHVVAPGALCFPGGGIEAGESEAEALIREFREELGAAVRPIRRVWQSTTPWQIDLAWWLGQLEAQVALVPNPAEVASVKWLTPDQMLAESMLLESNRQFLAALAGGQILLE